MQLANYFDQFHSKYMRSCHSCSVGFFANRVQMYLNSIEVMCADVKFLVWLNVYRHNSEAHSYILIAYICHICGFVLDHICWMHI